MIEVVPRDVGMDVEELGDVGGGHWFRRLAHRDVDAATSRVAERRSEIADLLVEEVCVHRRCAFRHRRLRTPPDPSRMGVTLR